MNLLLRRAVAGDAAQLTVLAHRAKAHWGYPSDWMAAWSNDLTLTPSYIEQNEVWVAAIGGDVAGMCAIEDHEKIWALEHVWVDPEYQGRGIGHGLVERALSVAFARRPGPVMVVADPNAAGFYVRLGAKPAGSKGAPMPGAPDRVLPLFEFSLVDETHREGDPS
jgi:GNAT superfamily N-acetyltransferase